MKSKLSTRILITLIGAFAVVPPVFSQGTTITYQGRLNDGVNPASDRNLKENFSHIDSREVLAKVVALPVTEWNYKQDTASKHIGPMAQDFYATFGVGPDDKHIATIDEGGVALAAIQGLNQKLEQKESEIAELRARLEALEKIIHHQKFN